MVMKITQEYMDEEVINPMAKRFKELEDKIDLAISNTKHLVEQFDRVIKNMKKK